MKYAPVVQAAKAREAVYGAFGQSRLGMKVLAVSVADELEQSDFEITVGWPAPKSLKRRIDGDAKKSGRVRKPNPYAGPEVAHVSDRMSSSRNCH